MSDQVENYPAVGLPLAERASDNAPFVYVDHVSTFSVNGSVVAVTLEATRDFVGSDGVGRTERVVVCHLRLQWNAAVQLQTAIEQSPLLASHGNNPDATAN